MRIKTQLIPLLVAGAVVAAGTVLAQEPVQPIAPVQEELAPGPGQYPPPQRRQLPAVE
jgi:hypothetical protein